MELIFEFIMEVLFEGMFSLATNKKINKFIRYPLFILIVGFYGFIICLLFAVGIKQTSKNLIIGLGIIALAILLLIMVIIAFKKQLKEGSE